jgi:hypothetical protein
MHFMGGAKSGLTKVDVPAPGVCGSALCLNYRHCAAAAVERGKVCDRSRGCKCVPLYFERSDHVCIGEPSVFSSLLR